MNSLNSNCTFNFLISLTNLFLNIVHYTYRIYSTNDAIIYFCIAENEGERTIVTDVLSFCSYLILTNQTTYELVRRRRISYLRFGTPLDVLSELTLYNLII